VNPTAVANPPQTEATGIDLKNDHNVYILGAGFSREAGLPLISDFLLHMRDSHEWLKQCGRNSEADAVARVLAFRLKAASAAYYVNLDLENIEELFSLASASLGRMDLDIRIAIASTVDFLRKTKPLEKCDIFVESRSRVFQPLKHPAWASHAKVGAGSHAGRVGPFRLTKYASHVARLLGLFCGDVPKGENTFITFNYDTLIEEALGELKIPPIVGPGVIGAKQTASRGVPVLKLHGSVDWGWSKDLDGGSLVSSPDHVTTMVDEDRSPLLLPPTWKKSFDGPLLAGVWSAAVEKLSTATRIIIIGFSIPPTDMHFKYLLAAGLEGNVSLRQILFVNPDADKQLEPRAASLLRKSYIDSGIIRFVKMQLGTFTGFHHQEMEDVGRPSEYGTRVDIEPVSPS